MKPTETKSKLTFGIARHLFSWVICLGAVILIGSSASAQNVFALDWDSTRIDEFTPDGLQSIFASGLTSPHALAFDSEGNLFVADARYSIESEPNGAIYKFTPAGVRTTFALGVSVTTGLAFDSEGNLFVAEFYTGNIYKFTPNGVRTTFASGVPLPQGLAFDRAGNLFVGVSGGVDKFTPVGVQTAFASGLLTPFALAFDSGGNLFVADGGISDAGAYDYPPPKDPPDYGAGAAVYKFTPSGLQSSIASGIAPTGLAIDSADNLFIAESTTVVRHGKPRPAGSILKITPSGVRTTFASRLVEALAFQPTQTGTSTPTPTPSPTSTPLPVPMPALSVSVSPGRITQGADATFTISASTINPSDVTTVHYSMGGKAKSEVNYTLSGTFGQAEIAAGASSTTVTLHALTGPMKGQSKNAILKLMPATNYVLSNPRKATVTIVKGPPIVVGITGVTTQPLLGGMQVAGNVLRWDQAGHKRFTR